MHSMQSSVEVEEVDLTGLMESVVDSDEEEDDFFDPENGLLSRSEVNKPILYFSDSDSDSEDETPIRHMY